jgi:hypothetical protein
MEPDRIHDPSEAALIHFYQTLPRHGRDATLDALLVWLNAIGQPDPHGAADTLMHTRVAPVAANIPVMAVPLGDEGGAA